MNNKKMIAIELVLHNLDFMRIPIEYIGTFQLGGLTANERVNSEYWAEQFILSIDRSYKAYTYEFGVSAMDFLHGTAYVSYIERIYEGEGNRDRVYIDWAVQNQVYNKNQRIRVNKHGDFFLEVSEKKGIKHIFPAPIINSKDYTVFNRKPSSTEVTRAWIAEISDVKNNFMHYAPDVIEHLIKIWLNPNHESVNHWISEVYSFMPRVLRLKGKCIPSEKLVMKYTYKGFADLIPGFADETIQKCGQEKELDLKALNRWVKAYFKWYHYALDENGRASEISITNWINDNLKRF